MMPDLTVHAGLRFFAGHLASFEGRRLKFRYVNWRGVEHEYVIVPESVEIGPYDASGAHRGPPYRLVLHGDVISRDGDERSDMATRRRTFLTEKIQEIEVLDQTRASDDESR